MSDLVYWYGDRLGIIKPYRPMDLKGLEITEEYFDKKRERNIEGCSCNFDAIQYAHKDDFCFYGICKVFHPKLKPVIAIGEKYFLSPGKAADYAQKMMENVLSLKLKEAWRSDINNFRRVREEGEVNEG